MRRIYTENMEELVKKAEEKGWRHLTGSNSYCTQCENMHTRVFVKDLRQMNICLKCGKLHILYMRKPFNGNHLLKEDISSREW